MSNKYKNNKQNNRPYKGFNETEYIKIPDSSGLNTIEIEVMKPKIVRMVKNGMVPNPLMKVATMAIKGFKVDDITADEVIKLYELYCEACMVNPTFKEVRDYITDEQMQYIFAYGQGTGAQLNSFRTDKKNDTNHSNG